jgi:hypothetical protein
LNVQLYGRAIKFLTAIVRFHPHQTAMSSSVNTQLQSAAESSSLPPWLQLCGWLALPGTVALVSRLTYEKTILTWKYGWYAVGYALGHAYVELLFAMLFSLVGAAVFLVGAAVVVSFRCFHHRKLPHINRLQVGVLLFSIGLLMVPDPVWMLIGVRSGAAREYAPDYLEYFAASDHPYLVKKILEYGVPVDAVNASGATALNGACAGKHAELARYLLSKGADISRAPACRWFTPISGKTLPRIPPTTITVTPNQ